jgi:hypothetical protein
MVNLSALIRFNDGSRFAIYSGNKIEIELDKYRTKKLGEIPWGIISNIARIKFKDTKLTFKSYLKDEYIQQAVVEIYFDDESSKYLPEDLLGTFYISDVDYSDNTDEVTINLNDGLVSWQSIEIPPIYKYDAGTLYDVVIDSIGDAHYQKYFKPFDSYEAKNILTQISLNSGINWEKSNLWNLMQKVCEASRCCLYTNEKGKAILERPKGERIVVVNPKNIYGISEQKRNIQNKVQNASIIVEKRKDYYGEPITNTIPIVFYKEFPPLIDLHNIPELSFNSLENSAFVGTSIAYNPQLKGTNSSLNLLIDTYVRDISMNVSCEIKKNSNRDLSNISCELTASRVIYRGINTETMQPIYEKQDHIEEIRVIEYDDIRKKFALSSTLISSFNIEKDSGYLLEQGNIVFKGNYYESDGYEEFSYNENASSSITQLPTNDLILNTTSELTNQLAKNNLDYVKKKYFNGIETVVLKCYMDNYYNSSGEQVIYKDTKNKRTFKQYDIILPYVVKNGKKVPYSTYENGRAKSFEIVGIKYRNHGVLWQELYLEEYINV